MLRCSFLALGMALACLAGAVVLAADEAPKNASKLPEDAKAVLEKAEQVELLSLRPNPNEEDFAEKPFHGYPILGKTTVKDADARKKILAALEKGLAENVDMAKCFIPRHGIRASHDGTTVDLVICFECNQVQVYLKDKQVGNVLPIGKSPEAVLDELLKAGGAPLAPKAGK